jgi:hypothetical protein
MSLGEPDFSKSEDEVYSDDAPPLESSLPSRPKAELERFPIEDVVLHRARIGEGKVIESLESLVQETSLLPRAAEDLNLSLLAALDDGFSLRSDPVIAPKIKDLSCELLQEFPFLVDSTMRERNQGWEDSSVAILTPEETTHPIFGGMAQRSLLDNRSFSFPLRDLADPHGSFSHLVVKGGDPLFRHGVHEAVDRISVGEIPGMGTREHISRQFHNCLLLHSMARECHGSLAAIPVPHSVREILTVPDPHNRDQQIPIREFMNSDHYIDFGMNSESSQSEVSRELLKLAVGMHPGDLVGDHFLDHLNIRPAQLIYHLEGSPLRCREFQGLMLFRGTASALNGNDPLLREDTTSRMETRAFGGALEEAGYDRSKILRSAYKYLGEAWGLPLDAIVPIEKIHGKDIAEEISAIRYQLQENEIPKHILTPFVERLTETVALAHSHGYTFAPVPRRFATSLHPRNVTINGAVCDLDTFREAGNDTAALKRDFIEMMYSIATLERTLSMSTPHGDGEYGLIPGGGTFVDYVIERYEESLDLFSTHTGADFDAIRETTCRDKELYERMLRLFYG